MYLVLHLLEGFGDPRIVQFSGFVGNSYPMFISVVLIIVTDEVFERPELASESSEFDDWLASSLTVTDTSIRPFHGIS